MSHSFTSLLLLFPLYHIASCKTVRVASHLKGGLNLDMTRGSKNIGSAECGIWTTDVTDGRSKTGENKLLLRRQLFPFRSLAMSEEERFF
jgi:hypothetical protein